MVQKFSVKTVMKSWHRLRGDKAENSSLDVYGGQLELGWSGYHSARGETEKSQELLPSA